MEEPAEVPTEKPGKKKGQSLCVIIPYWPHVQAIVGGERAIHIHVVDSGFSKYTGIVLRSEEWNNYTTTSTIHTALIEY